MARVYVSSGTSDRERAEQLTERLRKAPLGYFFEVMTEGFGAMPEYAEQIPPRDRWCIVAYIRALQASQRPFGNPNLLASSWEGPGFDGGACLDREL